MCLLTKFHRTLLLWNNKFQDFKLLFQKTNKCFSGGYIPSSVLEKGYFLYIVWWVYKIEYHQRTLEVEFTKGELCTKGWRRPVSESTDNGRQAEINNIVASISLWIISLKMGLPLTNDLSRLSLLFFCVILPSIDFMDSYVHST